MMLRGLPVLLKFWFGGVLDVVRSQRGFEYRQLLVRLEASEALGRFHHAGGGPAQRHVGILPPLHLAVNAAASRTPTAACAATCPVRQASAATAMTTSTASS